MKRSSECSRCGVAYDVGYWICREPDCAESATVNPPLTIVKAPPKKQPNYYYANAIPHMGRWVSTKARARKKDIAFDLTPEFVKSVMESPCTYCSASGKYSELDKKDPLVGYLMSNVVPACRRCNVIKSNVVSYDEMMFIAEYLRWRV